MQSVQPIKCSPESSCISITDADVVKIINLRESKAFIKKRLEQIDSDLAALEENLIARIEGGARIESHHYVSIKTTERRCPSWKDAFISVAGELEAKRIIDSTTPTISKSVVIANK
ncbi:MAG: hypothetical protein ACLGG0_14240 [Bacteriovoracia bacterium]